MLTEEVQDVEVRYLLRTLVRRNQQVSPRGLFEDAVKERKDKMSREIIGARNSAERNAARKNATLVAPISSNTTNLSKEK